MSVTTNEVNDKSEFPEYLDSKNIKTYAARIKIRGERIPYKIGNGYSPIYFDDDTQNGRDVELHITGYTKFGVSENKSDDADDNKKGKGKNVKKSKAGESKSKKKPSADSDDEDDSDKKKKKKKSSSEDDEDDSDKKKKKKKSSDDDEDGEKGIGYGFQCPLKHGANEHLQIICDVLDDRMIKEYSLHSVKLGNEEPMEEDLVRRAKYNSCARKGKQVTIYGKSYKWKVHNDTQYFIRDKDGFDELVTRDKIVEAKGGLIEVFGKAKNLFLGDKVGVICEADVYILRPTGVFDITKYEKFLNLKKPVAPLPGAPPAQKSKLAIDVPSELLSNDDNNPGQSTSSSSNHADLEILGVTGPRQHV